MNINVNVYIHIYCINKYIYIEYINMYQHPKNGVWTRNPKGSHPPLYHSFGTPEVPGIEWYMVYMCLDLLDFFLANVGTKIYHTWILFGFWIWQPKSSFRDTKVYSLHNVYTGLYFIDDSNPAYVPMKTFKSMGDQFLVEGCRGETWTHSQNLFGLNPS